MRFVETIREALSALRANALRSALTLLGMVTGLVSGWLEGPQLLRWAGYAVAYVFGGWYGLKGAIETLRHRAVDIDLLMIVAALGALSIGAPFEGAMLLFLFSLSNTLQHYAIGRSRRAIKSLVEMRPDEAQILRDGEEVTVPIDDVAVGDVFVVRPGDKIPLDGVVSPGDVFQVRWRYYDVEDNWNWFVQVDAVTISRQLTFLTLGKNAGTVAPGAARPKLDKTGRKRRSACRPTMRCGRSSAISG